MSKQKKTGIVICIIAIVIAIISMQSDAEQMLEIYTDSMQIPCVLEEQKDSKDGVQPYMEEEALQYVELGTVINIKFKNAMPENVQISDMLLDENGNELYSEKEIRLLDFSILSDNEIYITLQSHPASLLSSQLESYQSGHTIRGFQIACEWDEEYSNSYFFAIRTDAY
ncbi:MAG: hypothetical protein LIO58_05250 [Oscillospiraceae bacterium]|nr:hypothetical protein [Oscillospiraceae bacterium]